MAQSVMAPRLLRGLQRPQKLPWSGPGRCWQSTSDEGGPKRTCLYDFHLKVGGKMVDFGGYLLPVQYGKHSISASHLHTRNHCSIFDVSHMLQTHVRGKDRIRFMQRLAVADVEGMKANHSALSLFTNPSGGIIDDLIITKTDLDYLYVVSNAGCRHKDMPLMKDKAAEMRGQGLDVEVEFVEDFGLLALQGPESSSVLQKLVKPNLGDMAFMTSQVCSVDGVEGCRVTRCGYTGEDGFELSIPSHAISKVAEALLGSKEGSVMMAGLGARDSLRLEAGLCLYGNDISEETSPVEAGLVWTIGKNRRNLKGTEDDFPGAEAIIKMLHAKPTKKRVGLISKGAPARSHTPVLDLVSGKAVGEVTSGCPSPSMDYTNIAMAYVPVALSAIGTKVNLSIRNRTVEATVVKLPFVPTKYYSKS